MCERVLVSAAPITQASTFPPSRPFPALHASSWPQAAHVQPRPPPAAPPRMALCPTWFAFGAAALSLDSFKFFLFFIHSEFSFLLCFSVFSLLNCLLRIYLFLWYLLWFYFILFETFSPFLLSASLSFVSLSCYISSYCSSPFFNSTSSSSSFCHLLYPLAITPHFSLLFFLPTSKFSRFHFGS